MSVNAMGEVWKSDLPYKEKYVLLAFADHADHDGYNVYPSVSRIAWKTGFSARTVQRAMRELEKREIMIKQGNTGIGTGYGTNLYRIDFDKLPKRPDYSPPKRGDSVTPFFKRGDSVSPQGCQPVTPRGVSLSPKPSVKPSVKPSEGESLSDSQKPETETPPENPVEILLSAWSELFPEKPQPRATTRSIREKVRARWASKDFRDNWRVALEKAARSPTLQKESWFDFRFFIRNEENYQKCLDEWMAWKDQRDFGDGKTNGKQPRMTPLQRSLAAILAAEESDDDELDDFFRFADAGDGVPEVRADPGNGDGVQPAAG